MKESFSWRRFGLLARAELAGERRGLLLKLSGFVVFCAVMYMLWNIRVIFDDILISHNSGLGYIASRFCVVVGMGFIVYFNLSGSFKRFFSRGKAPAAFMLPAARSEKFLYALLLNLIVVPAVLIVIAVLNDVLWADLLGFENIWNLLGRWWSERVYLITDRISGIFLFANIISVFSGMAFFLLGAVVFRRHQFLLTLLVNFALSIPTFIWIQTGVMMDPTKFWKNISWLSGQEGAYVTLVWSVLWLGVWILLAWRRFSTLQITK